MDAGSIQKRNLIVSLLLQAISILWMIGISLSSYRKYNADYEGISTQCKLKYNAHIRCTYNNRLVYNEKIDDQECVNDDIQCNAIRAAFPITILVMFAIFIAMILTAIKYSTFPRNSYSYNLLLTLLTSLGAAALLSIGLTLCFSLIGEYSFDLNGWILASQILIPILLFVSVKFVREEEQVSFEIREQQKQQEFEIKALTVL